MPSASRYLAAYIFNAKIHHPELKQKRVNVDFPIWMIKSLDHAAKEPGVTCQSLIKVWLSEKLKDNASV